MTQSYGPEARGGACESEVIISNEAIDFPKVVQPDVLVVMSEEAYLLYNNDIKDGGTIILDEDLVPIKEKKDNVKFYKVPAARIAEQLGNRVVANVVMLGALIALTQAVSAEAMKETVRARWPKFAEINLRALEKGMEKGRELKA